MFLLVSKGQKTPKTNRKICRARVGFYCPPGQLVQHDSDLLLSILSSVEHIGSYERTNTQNAPVGCKRFSSNASFCPPLSLFFPFLIAFFSFVSIGLECFSECLKTSWSSPQKATSGQGGNCASMWKTGLEVFFCCFFLTALIPSRKLEDKRSP